MVGQRLAARTVSESDHSTPSTGGRRRLGANAFKDAAHLAVGQKRRRDLKKKILDGVESMSVEQYRKSEADLNAIKNKKLRKFYEEQNETLNDWAEVDSLVFALADDVLDSMNPDANRDGIVERDTPLKGTGEDLESFLPPEEREKRAKNLRTAKRAVNVNVIANVFLLAAKIVAVFSTHSLSLIASLADSALDLLCTLIIWSTSQLVQRKMKSLQRKFPVGRRRLEPIGILVFSIIMVVSFLQILQESVTKLLPSGDHKTASLPAIAIGAMLANAVIKGIIGLFCMRIKTTQVQALVQDCKTDVYFNVASLLFPLIGIHFDIWWLDPLGAALLSLFIIYDWADTCLQNISRLTGAAVPDSLERKLLFLAWRFSPVIDAYKSMTAYYAGDGVWVEFDILFDEATSLTKAHDVSETLQYCLEGLTEVDRSFVTVDYSSMGPTGHATVSG